MKPTTERKRHKRWYKACIKNWIPFISSSKAYRSYLSGDLSFHTAFDMYSRACKRHSKTNYDDLWVNTTKERYVKATALRDNNMPFAKALDIVNQHYRFHLRQIATSRGLA